MAVSPRWEPRLPAQAEGRLSAERSGLRSHPARPGQRVQLRCDYGVGLAERFDLHAEGE